MIKAKKPAKRVKAGQSKTSAADRRAAFVEAFLLNGGNATDAALRAGFSPKTAYSQGSRLLKNVEISTAIANRQQQLAEKYRLTTDDVIRSISQELHFDPAKIYNADGSLKSVLEMDEDTRMALTAIECEEIGGGDTPVTIVRKFKWAAKHQAREQAMKHLGMFEKDNQQKAGMFDAIPRDILAAIEDELRAIAGMAEEADAGSSRRVTH